MIEGGDVLSRGGSIKRQKTTEIGEKNRCRYSKESVLCRWSDGFLLISSKLEKIIINLRERNRR